MAQHCRICLLKVNINTSVCVDLPSGTSPSDFPSKTLYAFLPSFLPRALYAGNSSVGEIIMEIMLIVNNMLAAAVALV